MTSTGNQQTGARPGVHIPGDVEHPLVAELQQLPLRIAATTDLDSRWASVPGAGSRTRVLDSTVTLPPAR
jgi:hypothetical protein